MNKLVQPNSRLKRRYETRSTKHIIHGNVRIDEVTKSLLTLILVIEIDLDFNSYKFLTCEKDKKFDLGTFYFFPAWHETAVVRVAELRLHVCLKLYTFEERIECAHFGESEFWPLNYLRILRCHLCHLRSLRFFWD